MSVRYFSQQNPRLRLFYLMFAGLFLFLATGLAWRQLASYQEFRDKESRQKLRQIIQPGPRGTILDRHGRVLVENRPRFSAVVYLDELRKAFDQERYDMQNELWEAQAQAQTGKPFTADWDSLLWESRRRVLQRYLDQINGILNTQSQLDMRDVKDHFVYRLVMPFPLVSDLKHAEYARLIEQLPLGSKIDIYTDTARHYPHGDLAAHTLGYVRATKDVADTTQASLDLKTYTYRGKVGINGLEKAFDARLQGESGGEVCVVDRFQFKYQRIDELSRTPKPGKPLVTTLDIDLQKAAEAALGDKVGAVVALDVNSGEVLVLASKPDYDLNVFSPSLSHADAKSINERGAWLNRATQGAYPPGSTFKMITAIAAMRGGIMSPEDRYPCGTHFRVGNRLFPEHSGGPFGEVDLRKMLMKSSNVYCYQIAIPTGIDRIAAEARRFGLHEQTGIELPYEVKRMQVPDKAWSREVRGYGWVPGDTANVSIGQGDLLVSPMQMAAFTASLARRETRTQVTLLHEPGRIIQHGGEPIGLSDAQYAAIIDGMAAAAGPGGTARFLQVPGVAVAAKTGTAQVKIPGRKLVLAWTVAFAPVDKPEIAIAVLVEGQDPNDRYAGGATAAPIAREVFRKYFRNRPTEPLAMRR